jgi:hypothetical protein
MDKLPDLVLALYNYQKEIQKGGDKWPGSLKINGYLSYARRNDSKDNGSRPS